jgi:hypothetical protein
LEVAIKTSSAKGKGRKLQQHCRDRILAVFNLQEGDAASTSMGAQGVDVPLSPHARKFCPLSIECKNVKKLDLPGAMRQSIANKYEDTYPVVVHKPYRVGFDESLVTLRFEDLLNILSDLHHGIKYN